MRAVIAGCALLLIGSAAARAQPYDGDGDPLPPRQHHRHCRIVEDLDGPCRICRPDF